MSFDPNDWFFKTTYFSTEADAADFAKWTAMLPKRSELTPYHCGAPNVNKFRLFLNLVHPVHLLEIGFNLGHSSMLWLNLGVERVTSVDVRENDPLLRAGVAAVREQFGSRIEFKFRRELTDEFLAGCRPAAIFIDGGHMREDVAADIELGQRLGVRHFFFDDFDLHHGPGVQPAIIEKRLMPQAIFANMAYCVPLDGWEKRE